MKLFQGSSLLVVAVLTGVVAAVLSTFYLQSVEERYRLANQPEPEITVAVVVPRENMLPGQRITQQSIASRQVPEEYLPANAILASQYREIINRTLIAPVERGRPMTLNAVTDFASERLSDVIPLGRRAYSIRVSRIESFDGLLRPGDRVDIMGSFRPESLGLEVPGDLPIEGAILTPVVSQVRVLAASREDANGTRYELTNVSTSTDNFDMEFASITLDLSAEQVVRIQAAQQAGTLFPVLKNKDDTTVPDARLIGPEILLTPEPEESIDIVLSESGEPIGQVIGDKVVDGAGRIVGRVVAGQAVGLDGESLGAVVTGVSESDPINRIDRVVDVVRDAQGNIIGEIVDGNILDEAGNIIGRVETQADGSITALDLSGQVMGEIEPGVALDEQGNEVDLTASRVIGENAESVQIVRDADGNLIGRVLGADVVDAEGNVIARIDNGRVLSLDGEVLAENAFVESVLTVSVEGEEAQKSVQRSIRQASLGKGLMSYEFVGSDADEGVIEPRKIQIEQ